MTNQNSIMIQSYYNDRSQIHHKLSVNYCQFSCSASDMADLAGYVDKYDATSRGINIKTLSHMLRKSKNADDEFNVTFTLFAL